MDKIIEKEKRILEATQLENPNENDLRIVRHFFPQHRDLPIVAQDYSYTMDIMFITSMLQENTYTKDWWKRTLTAKAIRNEDKYTNGVYKPSYIGGLYIIETTSRKVWVMPLYSKDPAEVLYRFKQFYNKVDGKVARLLSDKGQEYDLIKKWNKNYKLFHYYQVNASQNMHTTLSRVDRGIATLKNLIYQYYSMYNKDYADWEVVLPFLVKAYNNTKHNSLFLKNKRGEKYFYTPEQVWANPELRRRIKIKDYLRGYQNYIYIDKFFKPGVKVFYRLTPKSIKSRNHNGFLSQYPAEIVKRVGNAFKIRLKGYNDNFSDKKTITVPARDLVLAKNISRKSKSKYKISKYLEKIRENVKNSLINKGVNVEEFEQTENPQYKVHQIQKPTHKRKKEKTKNKRNRIVINLENEGENNYNIVGDDSEEEESEPEPEPEPEPVPVPIPHRKRPRLILNEEEIGSVPPPPPALILNHGQTVDDGIRINPDIPINYESILRRINAMNIPSSNIPVEPIIKRNKKKNKNKDTNYISHTKINNPRKYNTRSSNKQKDFTKYFGLI